MEGRAVGGVVVLGIGSPNGLDDMGWRVVGAIRALVERGVHANPVVCQTLPVPDGRVLEALAGAGLGIVVDALLDDPENEAGVEAMTRFQDLDEFATGRSISSHGLGLAEILRLGRALGDLPERMWIYAVRVGDGRGPDAACIDTLAGEILADIEADGLRV
ncbi:MAG: hypothetical protein ACPGUC_03885 [Gammaproteobacteria bacterium]